MQAASLPPQDVIQDALRKVYEQSLANVSLCMPESASQGVLSAIYGTVLKNVDQGASRDASQDALREIYATALANLDMDSSQGVSQRVLSAIYTTALPDSELDVSQSLTQATLSAVYKTVVANTGIYSLEGAGTGELPAHSPTSTQFQSIRRQSLESVYNKALQNVSTTHLVDVTLQSVYQQSVGNTNALEALEADQEAISLVLSKTYAAAGTQLPQDRLQPERAEDDLSELPAREAGADAELRGLAEYEDRILAKAMLPDTFERCWERSRTRSLGVRAAMQIEVERYVENLTEDIHDKLDFPSKEDEDNSSGAGDSGVGVPQEPPPEVNSSAFVRERQEQRLWSTPAQEITADLEESGGEAQAGSASEVLTRVRGHIESLVQASISAGVAKSKEVPEQEPDLVVADDDEPVSQAEAPHPDATEDEVVQEDVSDEQTPVFHYEPPASASALPRGDPPWSASEIPAPPATAPGGLSSMTGLEVRVPDAQSALPRQESFKVLAALYGPSADQKLAQRQSVSAGSAWSTRSAWSAGPGISTMSTSAPNSMQPTPPSTAPPASRLAARAKCRAVRQPRAEEYDAQGSHLIHKKHDPIRLRQLDQDRLRNRFVSNMRSNRNRETVSKRQTGVLQEYYWRMRDMQAESKCRKQERSWQDREQVRRKEVEQRRQGLAEQSDESLNRRYGRFYLGPQAYFLGDETPGSWGQASRPSSTQRAKESEMEALWESEDLNLFQEAYQDAVGRLVSPEPAQKSPAGEHGEQEESLGPQRASMISSRQSSRQSARPPPKQQAAVNPMAPEVVLRENVTWEETLRSPLMMAPSPTQQPKDSPRRQRAWSSSIEPQSSVYSAGQRAESAAGAAGPPVHVSKALPAGLIEWESWRNPWRGRRRGAPPPVEVVVNAMLHGEPAPAFSTTPDEAERRDSGHRKGPDMVELPINAWMRTRGSMTTGGEQSIATMVAGSRRSSYAEYEEHTSRRGSAEVTNKLPPVQPPSARQAAAGKTSPAFSSESD